MGGAPRKKGASPLHLPLGNSQSHCGYKQATVNQQLGSREHLQWDPTRLLQQAPSKLSEAKENSLLMAFSKWFSLCRGHGGHQRRAQGHAAKHSTGGAGHAQQLGAAQPRGEAAPSGP